MRLKVTARGPDGIRAGGKQYPLDIIVFATGFDAMTGAMKEIDFKGKGGLSINEKWKDGRKPTWA